MCKTNNNLALAWEKLSLEHGEQTPKQIKHSLFIIQNHLLQFPDPTIEQDEELLSAALDLKLLYGFLDDVEPSTNLKN